MIDDRASGAREGDLADGYQWTGSAWVASPSFPTAPVPPPAVAASDRTRWLDRPWLVVLGSMLGAIVIISTMSVALGGAVDAEPSAGALQEDAVTAPQVPEGPEPVPATFDPIVLTGTGDAIERIAVPAEAGDVIVTAEYSGSGNFVVWALSDQLLPSELAVNQIGSYRGSSVIAATTAALQIQSDGAWTLTVRPLGEAPSFDRAVRGTGSTVLEYTGGKGIATLAHDGPGTFSVTERADSYSSRLLVNVFGPYSGQHIIGDGPSMLVVEADGDWEVTVE